MYSVINVLEFETFLHEYWKFFYKSTSNLIYWMLFLCTFGLRFVTIVCAYKTQLKK